MPFTRVTESVVRDILEILELAESPDPEAILARLGQLRRALAPEHEFSLILNWLGKCRLVHRLAQEQLPLSSTDAYRIPDLLAVFEHENRLLPVLIEVKTTETRDPMSLEPGRLSIKPHYSRYAELLSLPMLIAWRHRGIWSLFDVRRARRATTNLKMDFFSAMEENLLGVLAGDFSYRLMPGTALRMPMRKLTEPDEKGEFTAVFHDIHFTNPAGERIPHIPHMGSLFMFWENEAVVQDEGTDIVQSFVVPDLGIMKMEFASRTLSRIVYSLAQMTRSEVNWRTVVHDSGHLAHDVGRLQALVDEGAKFGVTSPVINQVPKHLPDFLQ